MAILKKLNAKLKTAKGTPSAPQGTVHALVCGIDYSCDFQSWAGPPPKGSGPLDTGYAFRGFQGILRACGVSSVKTLWNQQCTRAGLRAACAEVGRLCKPGDYFLFYYTGHGDQLPAEPEDDEEEEEEEQGCFCNPLSSKSGKSGHESEQQDQCFCLVDANGNTDDATMTYRQQVWMRDDEFADILISCIPDHVKMVVLMDCCHCATMCDFEEDNRWAKTRNQVISIAGSEDGQTSAGTGKGGAFSRALSRAIASLQEAGNSTYFVSELYNATLAEYQKHHHDDHVQNISIRCMHVEPDKMIWPLLPQGKYQSPADLAEFADNQQEAMKIMQRQQGMPQVMQQPQAVYAAPAAQVVLAPAGSPTQQVHVVQSSMPRAVMRQGASPYASQAVR
mmetsp:Transcript_98831/g.176045  ORF Transcript_98831/g.176045 Transcript_98831/m.176045 type:complete len:392 (-) Transcript_98831:101-1276(-)